MPASPDNDAEDDPADLDQRADPAGAGDADEPRWDANDPRRQHDQMAPPSEPCECYCLHCGRVFTSDQIWFQRVIGDKAGFDGFWMCPTPNCDGAGFTFDIFPTDPDHPANAGWYDSDEDDDEAEEYDEEGNPIDPEKVEYDPNESKYQEIEAADPDIEGDEWKHGLSPGEQLPEPDWHKQAREQMEEEERRYDMPDERPRELDWSDREPRDFRDEDIPF
jgi:hypothetical protein